MPTVVLPNGVKMKNVPSDATQGEIIQAAIASGKAKAEDFGLTLSETKPSDPSEGMGAAESFAVGVGRGMTNFGRGAINLFGDLLGAEGDVISGESDIVKKGMKQLKARNPISTMGGEIVGEMAPAALLPFGAAAGAATKTAQYAGTAALAGMEGAALARGKDESVLQGAALGAGGGMAGLYLAPIVERGFRKIANRLGFSTKQAIDPATGQPTPEFAQALADNNITSEDILDVAGVKNIGDARVAARKALFEAEGVPATRGDIAGASPEGFSDQATEARLFESAQDAVANDVRDFRRNQSRVIRERIESVLPETGSAQRVGETIKEALAKERTILKREKNAFYKQASEAAEDFGGIPIISDTLGSSLASPVKARRLKRGEGRAAIEEAELLLGEFGIIDSDEVLAVLGKEGTEILPLDVSNFEELRQGLNRIVRNDQSGASSVYLGDFIGELDNEVSGLADVIAEKFPERVSIITPLKQARDRVRQLKTEFSDQAIAGRLIRQQRDGFTPVVEASNVYRDVVGTNRPPEFIERVTKTLRTSAGRNNEKANLALQDLQAAALTDLVDSGFGTLSNKVGDEIIFNPNSFIRRFDQIGSRKFKAIFGEGTEPYKRVMRMRKIADAMQLPAGAKPKGSGNIILDALNKLGVMTLSAKIPMLGVLTEGVRGLAESGGARRQAQRALSGYNEQKVTVVKQLMPNLAASLAENLDDNEDQQ